VKSDNDAVSSSQPFDKLGAKAVHALSNHLAVILGFVELVLSETPDDDPRRPDLLEIRDAAVQASDLLGRPITPPDAQ
jgi:hypothetical protein